MKPMKPGTLLPYCTNASPPRHSQSNDTAPSAPFARLSPKQTLFGTALADILTFLRRGERYYDAPVDVTFLAKNAITYGTGPHLQWERERDKKPEWLVNYAAPEGEEQNHNFSNFLQCSKCFGERFDRLSSYCICFSKRTPSSTSSYELDKFMKLVEITAAKSELTFVIYLPYKDKPEGVLLSTKKVMEGEWVWMLIKHEEFWEETHLIDEWLDWDDKQNLDNEDFAGSSILLQVKLMNPQSTIVEDKTSVRRLTEIFFAVYRGIDRSSDTNLDAGENVTEFIKCNERYYILPKGHGIAIGEEVIQNIISLFLPQDTQVIKGIVKELLARGLPDSLIRHFPRALSSNHSPPTDTDAHLVSKKVRENLVSCVIEQLLRKTPTLLPKRFPRTTTADVENRVFIGSVDLLFKKVMERLPTLVSDAVRGVLKANGYILQNSSPQPRTWGSEGQESSQGGGSIAASPPPFSSDQADPALRSFVGQHGGYALPNSNSTASIPTHVTSIPSVGETIMDTHQGTNPTAGGAIETHSPTETAGSTVTGAGPLGQRPTIPVLSAIQETSPPCAGVSGQEHVHPSQAQRDGDGPSNVWTLLQTDLVYWLVRAETSDGHLKELVRFFIGKNHVTTYDLAKFICRKKCVTGKPAKLELVDEDVEEAEERQELFPKYWCSRGALLRRSLASAFAFYVTIFLVVGASLAIAIQSKENKWERAETFFNLFFTGTVAVVFALLGVNIGGRAKAMDTILATVAVKQLPASPLERKAALHAICGDFNESPAHYVDGPVSWMPEECRGYTRITDAVPLDEICPNGYLRIAAGRMVARICKQDRVMRMSDEGKTLLACERDLEKRFWQAIVRVQNRVERITPIRSRSEEVGVLVVDKRSKQASRSVITPPGSSDVISPRSSRGRTVTFLD